jgi:hypothetical protein
MARLAWVTRMVFWERRGMEDLGTEKASNGPQVLMFFLKV